VNLPHKKSQDIDSIASRRPEMGQTPQNGEPAQAALTDRGVEQTVVFRRLFLRAGRTQ
jgi:hypothetical protein